MVLGIISASAMMIWCHAVYLPFFFLLPGRPRRVLDSTICCEARFNVCLVGMSSSSPLSSSSVEIEREMTIKNASSYILKKVSVKNMVIINSKVTESI